MLNSEFSHNKFKINHKRLSLPKGSLFYWFVEYYGLTYCSYLNTNY